MKSQTLQQSFVAKTVRCAFALVSVPLLVLSAQAGNVITNVVETGGDNNAVTVPAKWTGVFFTNTTTFSLTNPPATGRVGYNVPTFGSGVYAYVDRLHVWMPGTNDPVSQSWMVMPSYLLGGDYIMIGNDNRDNANLQLVVSLAQPAYVYLLIDNRLRENDTAVFSAVVNYDPPTFGPNHMPWVAANGFKPMITGINRARRLDWPDEIGNDNDNNANVNDYHSVYVKHVPAGTITLFSPNNSGQASYGVVAVQAVPPAPTPVVARKLDGAALISWPAVGATNYIVQRATSPNGPFTPISTNAATSFQDTGLDNGTAYYYQVTALGALGESPRSATVGVTPAAAVTDLTATYAGASINLSWPAVGGALSYNVYRSQTAGGPYAALTTSEATTGFSDTTFTNGATYYYVISANLTGMEGSLSPERSVLTAPVIVTQPTNVVVIAGSNATLSVTAVGQGLTYQWMRNDTNVPGATSASLAITGATSNQAGPHVVVVANAAANVTSQVATVTVLYGPVITSQPPAAVFFLPAVSNSFGVGASSLTPPITYAWQKFDGVDWQPVVSDNLALPERFVQNSWDPAEAGSYRVLVTDASGTSTSAVTVVTVLAAVNLSATPPTSLVLTAGSTLNLSVTATGGGLSYRWFRNGTFISNATNSTLVVSNVTYANAGSYGVVVTNALPSTANTTNAAAVCVVTVTTYAPIITTQPVSTRVNYGANVNFSVVVQADPAATYQWQFNGANIPGATSASLAVNSVQSTNVGSYRVIASNASGSVTSVVAQLTAWPAITYFYPFDTAANFTSNFRTNGSANTYVHAASGGLGANAGSIDLANSTESSMVLTSAVFNFSQPGAILGMSAMVKTKQANPVQRYMQVGFLGDAASQYTDAAGFIWMTVRFNATSTGDMSSQARYQNKSSATTGFTDGPLATQADYGVNQTIRAINNHWYKITGYFQNLGSGNYQVWGSVIWYGDNPYTTGPGAIIHQFGPYIVNNPAICSDSTVYAAVRGADNSGTERIDDIAVFTNFVPPVIGQAPQSQTLSPGQAATLRVGVDGSVFIPTIQWYANGAAIPNATNVLYKTPYATAAMNGTIYQAVATTPAGSVTSAVARLTVVGTDSTAPTVVSAGSINPLVVGVAFSETMAAATANNPANYTVNGVQPLKATLQEDALSVRLDLAVPLAPGNFTVGINNLTDVAGNPLGSVNANGEQWGLDYLGLDVGYPLMPGRSDYSAGPGWVDLSAGGADVFGNNDSGYLFVRPITGDFDLKVKIQSIGRLPAENLYGDTAGRTEGVKMGLDVRDSVAFGAQHVYLNAFPANDGRYFPGANRYEALWRQHMPTAPSATLAVLGGVNNVVTYPESWVRMRRVGNTFSTYISTNGVDWVAFAAPVVQYNMPATAYVGLLGCARAQVSGIPYLGVGSFRNLGPVTYPGAAVNITSQPASTTVLEGANLVLNVAASVTGAPSNEVQYHWQRSGDAGATWQTVPGFLVLATNSAYTNFAVTAAQENGAQYRVIVSVPGASATSSVATVTVPDNSPLRFLAAGAASGQTAGAVLVFSEPVDAASAAVTANYEVRDAVNNLIAITGAQRSPTDPRRVLLTFGANLASGVVHTVTVANVLDQTGLGLSSPTSRSFTAPDYTANPVMIELYFNLVGLGGRTADILDDVRIAQAQSTRVAYTNVFGFNAASTTFADTALNNYAVRSRAYFVPPADGNYRFYIRSDDGSLLFMNTNHVSGENAEAVNLIAYTTGANANYNDNAFQRSGNFFLYRTNKYYMEVWQTEGTGGDGFSVMYRDSANATLPAATEFLGAANLAPVVGPITVAGVTPLNPTVTTNVPVVLKAAGVHGAGPYFIQWYKNGQPIPNANRWTYTTPALTLADNGSTYTLRVANEFSSADVSTTITVQPDVTPLQITAVSPSRWMDAVSVTFNKALEPSAAYNPANYLLDGGLTLRGIDKLSADGRTVTLRTSEHQEAMVYNLTAHGIATNFQAYLTVRGYLTANLFFDIDGGVVGNLTSHPRFINNQPNVSFVVQGFSIPQTAPSLDRFGGRLNGWFVPPISGNYQFYITADDGSQLFLNTNSTGSMLAEGKSLVALSDFANRNYDDLTAGTPRFSGRIPMVAGQKYYVEGLYKEATGGDVIRSAVRGPIDYNVPPLGEIAPGALYAYPVHPSKLTEVYILQAPGTTNIAVGSNATLAVIAIGVDATAPLTYMWQKSDGLGGYTNIVGAYASTYTTPPFFAPETANYRVMVYSPSGLANALGTVNVTGTYSNTNAPAILSSSPQTNGLQIVLTYNKPMDPTSVATASNYRVTDISGASVAVQSVVMLPGNTNVFVNTAPMVPGQNYRLSITNVSDVQNNVMADFSYSFLVPQGYYARKRYNLTTTSIANLITNVAWTNDVWNEYTFPTVLDLGSIADNYSLRLSGYIVPDRTGNHTFYIATDDHSELRISPDANPANMVLVAYEQGHAGGQRNWTGAGSGRTLNPLTGKYYNTTSNLWMEMGKPYYFEIWMREGSGGDYCGLAWQRPGEPIPVNGDASRALQNTNLSLPVVNAPAGVVNPLASITTNENVTVTFSPQYSGSPMSFQWLSNNVVIAGANKATYTTPLLTFPAFNNVAYRVVVWSPVSGNVTSTPTVITLQTDLAPPTIVGVQGGFRGSRDFLVTFSEPVSLVTATNPANYTASGPGGSLTVEAATLQPNGRDVLLRFTTPSVEGDLYTVGVAGVTDRSSAANPIGAGASATATAWRFATNFVYFEVFNNVGGVNVSDLTSSALYLANTPTLVGYSNVASYGASLTTANYELYGFAMRGYFLPPANDNYVFYLQHDDGGILNLSTNGTGSGVGLVINQPSSVQGTYANGVHSYTNNAMLAGTRYFFEVLGKEGTGGDYWRLGVTNLLNSATPPTRALTMQEIGVYAPPATVTITMDPTNVNILENRTATFYAEAMVSPAGVLPYLNYQWLSNDVPVPGANGKTYTTPIHKNVGVADTYKVVVSAPGAASAVSASASVTVAQDDELPLPEFAGTLDGQTIFLRFNELLYPGTDPVNDPGAQSPSFYEINYTADGISEHFVNGDVVSAVLLPDGRTLRLTLWAPMPNRQFMVRSYVIPDLTTRNFSFGEMIAGENQGYLSTDMGLLGGTMVGVSSNYMTASNGITVNADGADIWGTADGGNFLYREVTGNFDVNVQVAGLWRADFWSKAGLMARVSATNTAYNVAMFATPNPTLTLTAQNTYSAQWRDPANTGSANLAGPTLLPYPDNWVRLKRVGNDLMTAYSTNGVDWVWFITNKTVAAQSATAKLLVGLATTAHTTATQTVADYRNLYFPLPPTITVEPSPVTIVSAIHGSATLTGAATNPANSGPLVYSWRKNGVTIPGATSASLVLNNLGSADTGVYILAAGNDGGEAWSVPVQVTVTNQAPVLGADSFTTPFGTPITFPVSGLTANDADPDGDALTLVGVFRTPTVLFYDFNSGLPTNTTVANNAIVDVTGGVNGSGVLKLTPAVASMNGIFVLDNPILTNTVVTEFTLDCKLFIGLGSGNPADGMAFAFGADITPATPAGSAEDGIGSGLSVCIDNYNSAGTEAPAIDIKYNNVFLAKFPLAKIRQTDYVDFHIRLDPDGTIDVAYAGNILFTNFPTGYVPTRGRFAIAARTGGEFEAHWVDDLRIVVDGLTPRGAMVSIAGGQVTYTPGINTCGLDTFYYAMTDGQSDGLVYAPVTVLVTEATPTAPFFAVGLTNQNLLADASYQAALPDLRGQVLPADNCEVISLSQEPAPGTLLPLGPNTITLVAADRLGLTATNSAVVTVWPTTPPTISAPPADLTVGFGNTATFTVSAYGGYPVQYQWKHEGTNIPGETGTTLEVLNVQAANAGLYTVGVSNSFNGIVSSPATLTVVPPPNTPPWITNSVSEGNMLAIPLPALSPGGGALVYGTNRLPVYGTMQIVSGVAHYTPSPGFNGADTFEYIATDIYGNSTTGQVRILVEATADLTPYAFTNAVNVLVGANPRAIVATDFLKDYKVDLAVANKDDSTVSLLRGYTGGIFSNVYTMAVGGQPVALALGDFNKDGKQDLAVLCAGEKTVRIYQNMGATAAAEPATAFTLVATIGLAGNNPVGLAVMDLNKDLYVDLAVLDAGDGVNPGSVQIFMHQLAVAAPVFGFTNTLVVGVAPTAIAAGAIGTPATTDKPDLLVANAGGLAVYVNVAYGMFTNLTNIVVGAAPSAIELGDLNGDKLLDIVVANGGSDDITVITNAGKNVLKVAGSFGVPQGAPTLGLNPKALALGNFVKAASTELKLDVAVLMQEPGRPQGHVAILRGNGTNSLNGSVPVLDFFWFDPGVYYEVGAEPVAMVTSDFNADKLPDLAVVNSMSGDVSVLLNNWTPLAYSQKLTLVEDHATNIVLGGTFGPLNYIITAWPTNGTLEPSNSLGYLNLTTNPVLHYTPLTNRYGKDLIKYTVDDGTKTSKVASIAITLLAVNDPPAFSNALNVVEVPEDWPVKLTNFVTYFTPAKDGVWGEEKQKLTYFFKVGDSNLFKGKPGLPKIMGTNLVLNFTPTNQIFGETMVEMWAKDSGGVKTNKPDMRPFGENNLSATQQFLIRITNVNDAPYLTKPLQIGAKTVSEDRGTNWLFTVADIDSDFASLSLTVGTTNAALLDPLNADQVKINKTVNPTNALWTDFTVTVLPATNAYGKTLLTFTVSDGTNTCSKSASLTVLAVNDQPDFVLATNLVTVNATNKVANVVTNRVIDLPASNALLGPANEVAVQKFTLFKVLVSPTDLPLLTAAPTINPLTGDMIVKARYATNATSITLGIYATDSGGTVGGGVSTSAVHNVTLNIVP